MADDFQEILGQVSRAAERLDAKGQDTLISALRDLAKLADDASEGSREQAVLTAVAAYINKRLRDLRGGSSDLRSLRDLRNHIVHGGGMKRSPAEFRKYASALWQALERSAEAWDPDEVSNLLAYCMGSKPLHLDARAAGPLKIIRAYKAIYNALDDRRQKRCLEELVMRLFSDARFRDILERGDGPR